MAIAQLVFINNSCKIKLVQFLLFFFFRVTIFIMSCHVMSYHIISYHIISYHIISYNYIDGTHYINYISLNM
jgi:hypothetical protein